MPRLNKVAILTFAYQRRNVLKKWIDHHSELFGAENLYVFSHSSREDYGDLAENCNFLFIPRSFDFDFDNLKTKWFTLQIEALLSVYSAVVAMDMDELLCLSPDIPGTLHEYILSRGPDPLASMFFNLIPRPDDPPINWSKSVLAQSNAMHFAPHLCNPMVFFEPVTLLTRHSLLNRPFKVDRNLMTFHLKYLDTDNSGSYYEALSGEVRTENALQADKRARMKGWSRGKERIDQWVAEMNTKPVHAFSQLDCLTEGMVHVKKMRRPDGQSFRVARHDDVLVFEVPQGLAPLH